MTRDQVNALCRALPGAEWSKPFEPGHDVWKVGDKIFACIGATTPRVSVKCTDIETAQMLIEAGVGGRRRIFTAPGSISRLGPTRPSCATGWSAPMT